MGKISLGSDPDSLEVDVALKGDFVTNLVRTDGVDWAAGTVFTLVIGEDPEFTWPTTLDGPRAGWNVDKATVNEMINSGQREAWLYYKVGDYELLHASGLVRVHG